MERAVRVYDAIFDFRLLPVSLLCNGLQHLWTIFGQERIHKDIRYVQQVFNGTPPYFFTSRADVDIFSADRIGDPEYFFNVISQLPKALIGFE